MCGDGGGRSCCCLLVVVYAWRVYGAFRCVSMQRHVMSETYMHVFICACGVLGELRGVTAPTAVCSWVGWLPLVLVYEAWWLVCVVLCGLWCV